AFRANVLTLKINDEGAAAVTAAPSKPKRVLAHPDLPRRSEPHFAEKGKGLTMNCSTCKIPSRKAGKHINGSQRYRCPTCKRRFIEPRIKPLGAMRVPLYNALLCLYLLVEGKSIRSIERGVGLEKKTI